MLPDYPESRVFVCTAILGFGENIIIGRTSLLCWKISSKLQLDAQYDNCFNVSPDHVRC